MYGFPKSQAKPHGLRPEHYEQIRTDNLLAERTAEACAVMHEQGKGYAVEQPLGYKSGSVSMFDLHCFSELRKRGAEHVDFHQCMFGAVSTKPTRFLYWNGRFDMLASRCDHPRTVKIGRRWASHPPLAGRDEHGNFKTKAASAYPTRLNMWIASIINLELARPVSDERRREPLEVTSEPPVGDRKSHVRHQDYGRHHVETVRVLRNYCPVACLRFGWPKIRHWSSNSRLRKLAVLGRHAEARQIRAQQRRV